MTKYMRVFDCYEMPEVERAIFKDYFAEHHGDNDIYLEVAMLWFSANIRDLEASDSKDDREFAKNLRVLYNWFVQAGVQPEEAVLVKWWW